MTHSQSKFFWKKWVFRPIDSEFDLNKKTHHYSHTTRLEPLGIVAKTVTDSKEIHGQIRSAYPAVQATPDCTTTYITNPETFEAAFGLKPVDGTAIFDEQKMQMAVHGPPHAGYFKTCVMGCAALRQGEQGFHAIHAAVLTNGTAIVGAAGSGKSTLSFLVSALTRQPLFTDDWSSWRIDKHPMAHTADRNISVSPKVFSLVSDQLKQKTREDLEHSFEKRPRVLVDREQLFGEIRGPIRIRRVFFASKTTVRNPMDGLEHSNYHVPFIFPLGTNDMEKECRTQSQNEIPFDRQQAQTREFWEAISDRVEILPLDTSQPVEKSIAQLLRDK